MAHAHHSHPALDGIAQLTPDASGQVSVTVRVDGARTVEGTPQFAAHLGQLIAGRPLPGLTYWRAGSGVEALYEVRFPLEPYAYDAPTVTVSLRIDNSYTLYPDVTSYVADATIPAPPADGDDDAVHEWEQEHLIGFTGVGNMRGDSFYDVIVTACSDPSLTGRSVQAGY